ncbi:MAG: hypothetical protein IJO21_00060 [Oscillospiraceae bacterium]|nr:hypothetical protein [Oscillospiraceae bacterium]MBQ7129427.1 hypothetical protein [Oscillospiraceae bacterium]
MAYLRKINTLLPVLFLMFALLPVTAAAAEETVPEQTASEYTWITDRDAVDGSDYTANSLLAQTLNGIFDGNANVFYDRDCTKMVNTKLGTYRVPNNGVDKYVGPYGDNEVNIGTSCWIYANGVYYTLFGEPTGCGTAGENSVKLDLSTTANKKATYENFTAWGVDPGVGALIRSRDGHSMIVLGYDDRQLTVLDGNGDGKGLVSIRVRTWDRIYFSAQYIIQPKPEHVQALYGQEEADTLPSPDNSWKSLRLRDDTEEPKT